MRTLDKAYILLGRLFVVVIVFAVLVELSDAMQSAAIEQLSAQKRAGTALSDHLRWQVAAGGYFLRFWVPAFTMAAIGTLALGLRRIRAQAKSEVMQ